MNLSETQIEDIIYNSPWLLNENYIIPQIKGSRGQYGRQVNPIRGDNQNKFIDLLFKDSRDNRPVIVELKKGWLTRDSIGQILEYKSLLLGLDEEEKEIWLSEFGRNYYCPKLILIGFEIEESIQIAANLAGIEIFKFNGDFSQIGASSFEDLMQRQQEWNKVKKSGVRAFHEREEWINDLLERINSYLEDFPQIVQTIKKVPEPAKTKTYVPQGNPFINIPFYDDDEDYIAGIYEFYDRQLPFDEESVYFEFNFVNESAEEELLTKLVQRTITFCNLNKLEYATAGPNKLPIPKVKREIIENSNAFNTILGKFLAEALEINQEYKALTSFET